MTGTNTVSDAGRSAATRRGGYERCWFVDGNIGDGHADDLELVGATLASLYDAGLTDVMDVLCQRVIGPLDEGEAGDRRERQLFDAVGGLQPNVRELLERLTAVGSMWEWNDDMRRARAREAIGCSGF